MTPSPMIPSLVGRFMIKPSMENGAKPTSENEKARGAIPGLRRI